MIRTASLRPRLIAALLALAASCAWSQEAAVTRRATELREAAGDSHRSLAPLPPQTPVTRLNERRGPWVQVRTAAGVTGWVHLFDLGPGSGSAAPSGDAGGVGALRGVTGLLTRGSGTTTATSGSGIRGLTAQDIANANPNLGAVGQLEAMRQSEADARSFADRAALAAVDIPSLAPARSVAPAGGGVPGQQIAP